jgi:hypothetical protein
VLVYELVGHWSAEDQPGTYVLLQGERRYRSSLMVGNGILKANVARVPASLSEELELLGIELNEEDSEDDQD